MPNKQLDNPPSMWNPETAKNFQELYKAEKEGKLDEAFNRLFQDSPAKGSEEAPQS